MASQFIFILNVLNVTTNPIFMRLMVTMMGVLQLIHPNYLQVIFLDVSSDWFWLGQSYTKAN